MDGPFPNQAESILEAERIVLIGFEIGVAPYISIFNYMMWVILFLIFLNLTFKLKILINKI